jgi:hypothetical protein
MNEDAIPDRVRARRPRFVQPTVVALVIAWAVLLLFAPATWAAPGVTTPTAAGYPLQAGTAVATAAAGYPYPTVTEAPGSPWGYPGGDVVTPTAPSALLPRLARQTETARAQRAPAATSRPAGRVRASPSLAAPVVATATPTRDATGPTPGTATPSPARRDIRWALSAARQTLDAARHTLDAAWRWPHLRLALAFIAGLLALVLLVRWERRRSRVAPVPEAPGSGPLPPAVVVPAAIVWASEQRPAAGTPYLQPLDLPAPPVYYPLDRPMTTIGAADDGSCDLVIDARFPGADSVAAQHARIENGGGQIILVDLRSPGGVYVNGLRSGEGVLADDCRITLGEVRFAFVANRGEAHP